jgi:hypothetical protein
MHLYDCQATLTSLFHIIHNNIYSFFQSQQSCEAVTFEKLDHKNYFEKGQQQLPRYHSTLSSICHTVEQAEDMQKHKDCSA